MDKIGQPYYGILEHGVFGSRIISGIITGIRFTEDVPIYEISFGNNRWETKEITNKEEELFKMLKLPSLERIKSSHGLKIKHYK